MLISIPYKALGKSVFSNSFSFSRHPSNMDSDGRTITRPNGSVQMVTISSTHIFSVKCPGGAGVQWRHDCDWWTLWQSA